ncbi:iron-containing alcohol dehydrogenase [Nocardioides convexus]|uniref:iron-containing alcohol dehydrogenase n=1 Tax=Nocardioides convexus TaxID=2712224 RepID=UPI0024183F86|nr:iron-containing alcohol dehydrogenase [Nocardioides convexus]
MPYCGSNPIADLWSEKALGLLSTAFRGAVHRDPGDPAGVEAADQMALAATFAGLGFGNAGVHIPHANAYPIAGRVRDFTPVDYPQDEPMVPHGMAVALTAPEAFRFTFDAAPERHLRAAQPARPVGDGPRRRGAARRDRPADAGHPPAQRPRRGRLRRGRRRRPGRRCPQAAAAARHRPEGGHRGGPGRDHRGLPRALVSRL